MDFTTPTETACLLVDNGSLRPAATLTLRRIADALAKRVSRPVAPVSLLHSNKVPAAAIGGVPAEILEHALRRRYAAGVRSFLVVPLFFGPSGALAEFIPERVRALAAELEGLKVLLAAPLAGRRQSAPDRRIALILADHVRTVIHRQALHRPVVVLVDHGSPQRAVAEVRNAWARQLTADLAENARAVVAASMERRDGAEYDFNEPLLERALNLPPCGGGAGDVVVAPLFFSPGRHAGPAGDIEAIGRAAEARHRGLRVHFAPLVSEHSLLIDVLADRYAEAQADS